jgi:hypothetical protein
MVNRVISTLFCLTGIVLINCGTPSEPVDSPWRSVFSLGDYYCNDLQCDAEGTVYIATENRILRFNGTGFETFAEFDGYDSVDMFTFDGGGAACLNCWGPIDYETPPALFRYKGGSWEQTELPDVVDEFRDFETVNADFFWVYTFAENPEHPENPKYTLYRYYYGEWTNYDLADHVIDTEVSSSGTFFAFSDGNPFSVLISEGDSDVWTTEPVVFNSPQFKLVQIGRSGLDRMGPLASYGDTLYAIAKIEVNGTPYYSLIKREGDPGEGFWVPLVICPEKAPDTHTIESVAFDGTGRGLIAGEETSIVSNGEGVWTKELFDYESQYLRGSPTGGFWAICRDRLYYHP